MKQEPQKYSSPNNLRASHTVSKVCNPDGGGGRAGEDSSCRRGEGEGEVFCVLRHRVICDRDEENYLRLPRVKGHHLGWGAVVPNGEG